uniref:Uncharacterized protein n=1 Tax=Rhizophora mucronata TaxID=61149 RepID=A0A2P2PU52_RHIMU
MLYKLFRILHWKGNEEAVGGGKEIVVAAVRRRRDLWKRRECSAENG